MKQQLHTSIFYADDDVDDLDFFQDVISEINESVTLFEEGEKLLHTLHNPPPNASVIFLDLNMPVKSGFDVLREIKSYPAFRSVPIVILTTSTNPNDIELCRNLGANLYVCKPTSIAGLRKVVKHVLSVDWSNSIRSEKDFVYQ